ncbi:MAG: transposase [Bryobacterales bacterium]|nr:transposase [Bryobacterales bacterium]
MLARGARGWTGQEAVHLLQSRYADCEKVTLVLDSLNTHTNGALHEAFQPKRARRLAERIQFCYTPKHGSWLNIAECELSSMTRQSLRGRRIGDLETTQTETEAWSTSLNQSQRGVDWHLTVNDARRNHKSVYPKTVL